MSGTITGALGSRAIIGQFYATLEQTQLPAWVGGTSFMVPSNQETEEYKWLGMTPAMREWIGARQAKGFRQNGLEIKNKVFESTLKVSVDDMRRDKTGQIMVRVDELAVRAALHPTRLLSDLINAGESTPCYDGQFFFDTDHVEGKSGTQSNDLVYDISDQDTGGTPTAPTPATIQRAVLQAVAAILGFKDDQGEPMNETASEFICMVPPLFMGPAITALTSTTLSLGEDNPLGRSGVGFTVRPAVNPRLNWTDKLAVFRTDGRVKPFIWQEEEGVQMRAVAEGSELEFNNREHHYGVTRICNAGYGYWQHACLTTLQA
ncbi:Mu-like prophage major head subunit gpT family protein [Roseococcus microcysteis]|uniref:Mu-like prophage major head subunit gpT family protein n=1 Tax=Roseococcus microcysteis TaxID=2771361 RepID=UPI00168BAC78|nr:Mu-like prophage major head subunit gpT family protein [Roseococcus microcysteis]